MRRKLTVKFVLEAVPVVGTTTMTPALLAGSPVVEPQNKMNRRVSLMIACGTIRMLEPAFKTPERAAVGRQSLQRNVVNAAATTAANCSRYGIEVRGHLLSWGWVGIAFTLPTAE
jgi:hypothetical protein